jgi:hypothetical protein
MNKKLALAAALLAGAAQAHVVVTDYAGTFAPEAAGATGTGALFLRYTVDDENNIHTLGITATFAGLSGTTSVAHVHCCLAVANTGAAGVALATSGNLPGWVSGLQAGSYQRVIDLTQLTSYSATFVSNFGGGTALGAEVALMAGLNAGKAYFNIHTNPTFTTGEIRAFVTQVPEPATYGMFGLGLLAMGAWARRRRA